MADRYALRDGERWWFYFEGLGDGHPVVRHGATETAMTPGERRGWWSAPAKAVGEDPFAADVAVVRPPRRLLTGYVLADDLPELPGLPRHLSTEEYLDLIDDENEKHNPRAEALYEPAYEEGVPTVEPFRGHWLVLEGAPPQNDGHEWNATLPAPLRESPEYLHLFPGYLAGFRKAVAAAIDELPDVKAYAASSGAGITVYLHAYLPPLSPVRWQKDRKRRRVREIITRTLELHPVDRITGENRASAVEAWNRELGEITGYVASLAARPCEACGGRGYIEPEPGEEHTDGNDR